MPCLVAFIILSILGLFSSTHRNLAKEAFGCIGRRMTLRPCDTGFQEKVQANLIGFLLKRSVFLARFVRKHFEILAWIFFILTIWSGYVALEGAYKFFRYGSCEGLNTSSFCVLDPTGSNTAVSGIDTIDPSVMPAPCSADEVTGSGYLSDKPLTSSLYPRLEFQSENEVTFIGCFECENTRRAYPTIRRLIDSQETNFTFIHQPTKENTSYLTAIIQCVYEENKDSDTWLDLIDVFFLSSPEDLTNPDYVYEKINTAGFDSETVRNCAESEEMIQHIQKQRQEVTFTGIYGTPLVFVNNTPVVGPKPYRVYRFLLY